jgi:hypothetical protein
MRSTPIGLSGLITPSLDEMVHVASEMERLGFDIPLLIGGATTSKAHTAVKIEPAYRNGPTIYVPDASRGVTVVTQLLSPERRTAFIDERRAEYATIRERNAASSKRKPLLRFHDAVANGLNLDWAGYQPLRPSFTGVRVFADIALEGLLETIDWTPFFISWDLSGKYPAIFNDPRIGSAARTLFDDAQAMLHRIIDEKLLVARAVLGFWPAQREGSDDVVLFKDESRHERLATLYFLRQQQQHADRKPNRSLADFIAPAGGPPDWIGAFAVSAGFGAEELAERFRREHDDYSAILVKALADRLAEALAEYMHREVRRTLWGYAADETLSNEDLIGERYRGIRPAPGYPACPDHTEKRTLFALLDAERQAGIQLTDSFAMYPAASVSGWYFAHPEARYFAVGRIGLDQIEDIARRKGISTAECKTVCICSARADAAGGHSLRHAVVASQLRKLAHIARDLRRATATSPRARTSSSTGPRWSDVPDILAELATVQMHAIQTSGNCIRNTTTDQFAGVRRRDRRPAPWCELIRQWSTFHPEFATCRASSRSPSSRRGTTDRAASQVHDIGLHHRAQRRRATIGFRGDRRRRPGPHADDRPRDPRFLPAAAPAHLPRGILRVYNRMAGATTSTRRASRSWSRPSARRSSPPGRGEWCALESTAGPTCPPPTEARDPGEAQFFTRRPTSAAVCRPDAFETAKAARSRLCPLGERNVTPTRCRATPS